MKQRIKILALLLLALANAGQSWADVPTYNISQGTVTGGEILFFDTEDFSGGTIDEAGAGSTVFIYAMPDGRHSGLNVAFTVEVSAVSGRPVKRL